jgi:hypothetical protein
MSNPSKEKGEVDISYMGMFPFISIDPTEIITLL